MPIGKDILEPGKVGVLQARTVANDHALLAGMGVAQRLELADRLCTPGVKTRPGKFGSDLQPVAGGAIGIQH